MLIHYCVVYTSTQLTFTQSMFFRTYISENLYALLFSYRNIEASAYLSIPYNCL